MIETQTKRTKAKECDGLLTLYQTTAHSSCKEWMKQPPTQFQSVHESSFRHIVELYPPCASLGSYLYYPQLPQCSHLIQGSSITYEKFLEYLLLFLDSIPMALPLLSWELLSGRCPVPLYALSVPGGEETHIFEKFLTAQNTIPYHIRPSEASCWMSCILTAEFMSIRSVGRVHFSD